MLARSFLLFIGFATLAQAQAECPDARFAEAVAPQPSLTVERVEGEVLATSATFPGGAGHAGNVCLVLLREQSGTQVAYAVTEQDGAFHLVSTVTKHDGGASHLAPAVTKQDGAPRFEELGAGDYMLIARPLRSEIAPVRVPLHVVAGAGAGAGAAAATLASAPVAAQRGLFVRFSVDGSGPPAGAGITRDLQLRQQLLARLKVDQDIRMEMIHEGSANVSPELQKRMDAIDSDTDRFLQEIVRMHGWPDSDLAGLDGSGAASTMLMHVSAQTEKQALPLIEAAVKRGTVQGQTYAMLFDHLRVSEGKPQRYGTVAKPFTADGEVEFLPIEYEANVDARRAAMGLSSLAEYRRVLKAIYFPKKE